MLRFIDQLKDQPIVGIRGGDTISYTEEPIINPHKMSVEAFYCNTRTSDEETVIFVNDIREVSELGLIVDSEDVIMPTTDLVRLEELIEINFQLLSKQAVTEGGKKLGRVENYVINDINFRIEKIYVRPGAIKSLGSNDLIISRRQIAGVNDKEVIVKETYEKQAANQKSRASLNPLGF